MACVHCTGIIRLPMPQSQHVTRLVTGTCAVQVQSRRRPTGTRCSL